MNIKKIILVNTAFEKISGYKKEELLGKRPALLKSNKHDKFFYKKNVVKYKGKRLLER